jgi:hypothetical protein
MPSWPRCSGETWRVRAGSGSDSRGDRVEQVDALIDDVLMADIGIDDNIVAGPETRSELSVVPDETATTAKFLSANRGRTVSSARRGRLFLPGGQEGAKRSTMPAPLLFV